MLAYAPCGVHILVIANIMECFQEWLVSHGSARGGTPSKSIMTRRLEDILGFEPKCLGNQLECQSSKRRNLLSAVWGI